MAENGDAFLWKARGHRMNLAKLGHQQVEPSQVRFRPLNPRIILLSGKRWRRWEHNFPCRRRMKFAVVLREEIMQQRELPPSSFPCLKAASSIQHFVTRTTSS